MSLHRLRNKLAPLAVAAAICVLTAYAVRGSSRRPERNLAPSDNDPLAAGSLADASMTTAVARIDQWFESHWRNAGLTPARPADDLTVLRRLSLALHGTVPSLEEIRTFEANDSPDRMMRRIEQMLADSRFADYFAERLARTLVGVDDGSFIVYRRDRFVDWLREQLARRRPYNEIVQKAISAEGLWTGTPATNFITAAANDGEVDPAKLAGRTARAFLGQRLDCAQCHDHPFDDWKQVDFEGLAAFFGRTKITMVGVEEADAGEYEVEDRQTLLKRTAAPQVPFGHEWLPDEGTRRQKLATWIVHENNRRFERAAANRAWGLLFGRALIEPVDSLPDPDDPAAPPESELLDLLGADFRQHGYRLPRLLQVIAASAPFRLDSAHDETDEAILSRLEAERAVFPLVSLRPEQAIGSMLQAASIQTIDRNSHWFVRAVRSVREADFLRKFGDAGEDELTPRPGTIPQTLLRMNGSLVGELANDSPLTAAGRIAMLAATDASALEAAYLAVLTRRPSPDERDFFIGQIATPTPEGRAAAIEDLYWSLFNSPEFNCNH